MRLNQLLFTFFMVSLLTTTARGESEESELPAADNALSQFVLRVINENPGVKAAQSGLVAGQARVSAASRPLYNPQLQFNLENAASDTRSISFGQTLDWSGKKKARTRVAGAGQRTLEARYTSRRWEITTELIAALAGYRIGRDLNDLSHKSITLMRQFARLAKRRINAGDLSQVEFDVANLAYVDARMQKAMTAAALARAIQNVRALVIHREPASWPTLQNELPAIERSAVDLDRLLVQLPDVLEARRNVELAAALVELRKKEKRLDPTLSLRGGKEDNASLIGLTLFLPIPIRNTFRYEVDAAKAEFDQAQRLADDTLRRARSRLFAAYESYTVTREAWQEWQRLGQPSLNSQADQLRTLWQSGELSTTDFLVQLKQTLDTRRSALALKLTLWNAWLGYLQASGQLDQWLGTAAAKQ